MLYCHMCFKLWRDDTDVACCDCGCSIDHMEATPEIHPMQLPRGLKGQLRAEVVMEAYRVYCSLYGRQHAMVTGGCRGGFGAGEIICLLYARAFPEKEWRLRFDEALEGMKCD